MQKVIAEHLRFGHSKHTIAEQKVAMLLKTKWFMTGAAALLSGCVDMQKSAQSL